MTSWETIVGRDLAKLVRPERIRWPRGRLGEADGAARSGATLVLGCEPALALEVSYKAREIADRINRYFGYGAISEVRVTQSFLEPSVAPADNSDDGRPRTSDGQDPVPRGDLDAALKALEASLAARATAKRRHR
jgi:hypothetical protein